MEGFVRYGNALDTDRGGDHNPRLPFQVLVLCPFVVLKVAVPECTLQVFQSVPNVFFNGILSIKYHAQRLRLHRCLSLIINLV